MLTDDTIEGFQNQFVDKITQPPDSLLLHPLYLRLGHCLPASLPRPIREGTVKTIFAMVHHLGSTCKHWTFVRMRLVEKSVDHYDPWPGKAGFSEVMPLITGWQQRFLPESTFTFIQMPGPRQRESVSCGAHVLIALWYLLLGHSSLEDLESTDEDVRRDLAIIARRQDSNTKNISMSPSIPSMDPFIMINMAQVPDINVNSVLFTNITMRRPNIHREAGSSRSDSSRPTERQKLDDFFIALEKAREIARAIESEHPFENEPGLVPNAEKALQDAKDRVTQAVSHVQTCIKRCDTAEQAEAQERQRFDYIVTWAKQAMMIPPPPSGGDDITKDPEI
ncbi:hypothetical protein BDP55DRAFT_413750 [Colletotrichum godetiae]|uniref:Ubiquitin-like protease family profile domain-containing protein n=1 Tax=Colletotrichum godetiae TaxID=1209918 RepID=A0AAJ0EMZ5_9PEZI|nr:uncharacterized protein BDP55DRAFT_413750 [Colletotrichum godetiae]KAK1658021.1 hypothetical protein BDP55DRAFT_413750 [Colletotrichum godetiae]